MKSLQAVMREVLHAEAMALHRLSEELPDSSEEAVRLLADCKGRVIVTGMGKMSAVARKFAATLCSTGTPASFMHPSEAHHGDLGMVTGRELLVAISNSGETSEIVSLIPYMKRHQVPVIAITGKEGNTLARNSDCSIVLGVEREADPVTEAPTTSTTAAMAMCDALAIALVHQRGFTREQFALFHPGGQLGRRMLLTIGDLMHSGDSLPLVRQNALLREAIVVISRKGLGAGLVTDAANHLLGIITDGDLRRVLEKQHNPLETPVLELLNRDPVVIDASQLAVEALNLMRQKSITVLPVTDSTRVVTGVVHLHDLLRAGLQ